MINLNTTKLTVLVTIQAKSFYVYAIERENEINGLIFIIKAMVEVGSKRPAKALPGLRIIYHELLKVLF